jgi:hypothetical protein
MDDAAADPFEPNAAKSDEPPKGPVGRAFDAVGHVLVAVLGVGVSLGMMVAPLLVPVGI